MALYTELFELRLDDTLRNRCTIAITVSADALLRDPTATADQSAWATNVSRNPAPYGAQSLALILAENKALTVEQIQGATDEQLQTQVDETVPGLVAGEAAIAAANAAAARI